MNQYWVMIHAVFDTPRMIGSDLMQGYFRNYAVNATSIAHAENLVIGEAEEAGAKVMIEESNEVVVEDLGHDIKKNFQSTNTAVVWYRSGRVFYEGD